MKTVSHAQQKEMLEGGCVDLIRMKATCYLPQNVLIPIENVTKRILDVIDAMQGKPINAGEKP